MAISKAADLEQAVTNIATIKPTVDISGAMASLAEMSRRVPQSATALADGLYNIFSSIEVGAEDGIELLEKFARGATGAGTDAQTFGTSILGVMNAYGKSVKDADHISDVFFNTVNAGVVTGEELAGALGPVTQSAKNAGVSIDELGALIAGVTKEGGPAAQNINNLSNLFMKFTTKEAVAAMKDMGVATMDAAGNLRPILDVMGDLKARLGPMTEAQRANALQAIFPDAQARTGASVILSQLDFVNGALKTNQQQVGSASKAYETMSGTFSSQTTILKNTFDSLLITVGAKLLPAITPLVTAFSTWLPGAFAAAEQAIKDLQPVFDGIGGVLGQVGAAVGNIALVAVPLFTQAFAFLQENSEAVGFALKAVLIPVLAAVAIAAGTAALGIITAMAPVVVPLAAIGAAAFLLYKVWNENLGGVRTKTEAIVAFLSSSFRTIVAAIEGLWTAASAIWKQFTDNPPRMIGLMIGSIVGFFLTLPTRINATLLDALGALGRFTGEALAAFQGFARDNGAAIGDFLSGLPSKFWNGAVAAVQGLIGGLGSMAGAAFNAVQNLFGGIVAGIKSSLQIRSPSKVFEGIGVSMVQGLEKGLDRKVNMGGLANLSGIAPIGVNGTRGAGGRGAEPAFSQQIVIELDGRLIGEVAADHMPRVLRVRGVMA